MNQRPYHVPDQAAALRAERRQELGLKLQRCLERIRQLEDWLLEHTDLKSTAYEARLAEYHTENRRYDAIENELKGMAMPPSDRPERRKEQDRMRNLEKRKKIRY